MLVVVDQHLLHRVRDAGADWGLQIAVFVHVGVPDAFLSGVSGAVAAVLETCSWAITSNDLADRDEPSIKRIAEVRQQDHIADRWACLSIKSEFYPAGNIVFYLRPEPFLLIR